MDNRRTLQTVFMFALFGFMFSLTVYMLFPFFTVILWTILLYILIGPFHRRCIARLNTAKRTYEIKRHILAGAFSVGILLLIIGPLTALSILLIHQLVAFLHEIEAFIKQNPDFFTVSSAGKTISNIVEKLSMNYIDLDSFNIRDNLIRFLHQYSSRLFSMGTIILRSTGKFLVSMLFISFALYFVFLDGQYLAQLIIKAIPINPRYMSGLMKKFTEITRHLFAGYILVALYQGIMAFIIMSIFRVKGALLFSVVLMFASFIPLLGSSLVWLPVGMMICFTENFTRGIVFLIISAICISLLDNFLRPLFLKDRIKVHPLIIFFSILGGLKVFGINGLLLGPMIIILFFTVLDLLVSADDSATDNSQE